MGANESTQASQKGEASDKTILPYGLAPTSSYVNLNSSYRSLYNGIVSLVQDNKYSDLVIICGTDRYPVHRAIVCPRSTWIMMKCEELADERPNPALPIKLWVDASQCDSHIVAAVLVFLYTLDYVSNGPQLLSFGLPQPHHDDEGIDPHEEDPSDKRSYNSYGVPLDLDDDDDGSGSTANSVDTPQDTQTHQTRSFTRQSTPPPDPGQPHNELVFHLHVYMAGKFFGIPALCEVAQTKFEKQLRCEAWKTEMILCIRELYGHHDQSQISVLRGIIATSARSRFRILKGLPGWDDLVLDFPEFAAEMLRRL